MRSLTQEQFIERAKEKWGDKFDLSKVKFTNTKTKIVVGCKLVKPRTFLYTSPQGCPKCGVEASKQWRRLPQEEFIKRAKEKHGDKYDYSRVKFVNSNTKVEVVCPLHGSYFVRPSNHLYRGGECPYCKRRDGNEKRVTRDNFIERATLIHGGRYDYSNVQFVNAQTRVDILCKRHGVFSQMPHTHLEGHGCPLCGFEAHTMTKDDFLLRARTTHGYKYEYDLDSFRGSRQKVRIICPKHGEFWQDANKHLSGYGCPKCKDDRYKESFERNVKEVWQGKYDLSQVQYCGGKRKITVVCPDHGPFVIEAHSFCRGHGCPSCHQSHGENAIRAFLVKNNIEFEQEKTFAECRDKSPLRFDFYIPSKRTAIEFQGEQHYKEDHFFDASVTFEDRVRHDNMKRTFCKENDIRLIEIKYDENIETALQSL